MSNSIRSLLLILAISFGLPVHAQDDPREPVSERESAGDRVREVERDGGRVLQAQPMQRSGREVYRLKVLTPEGRVRVLEDSRRRETRPESIDRGGFGREAAGRTPAMPSERPSRPPEPREAPAPPRADRAPPASDGNERSPP